ncbi:unnamed protein product [Didymodactylos carnosus]|uniref:Uncharacterized protein n=1 Tax=Didymodactylos carnosus TaxID=1234261 RepID=A0A814ED34_9BILA|nr:unnamed protein product [Didymodactylos carnosus]CAF0967601.1 unnamed protein product [Didymodactylos carnosus]CAF3596463.1 unnamed protein product [Didymodactylos carnosus]CAF3740961.1 unnamed protein product [Didymodactylos carnosus]
MTSFHEQIPNAFNQNNGLNLWTPNIDSSIDRLALQRAKHFESRTYTTTRSKSITSNEDISDWSESDRECAPLSDYESNGPYFNVISDNYNSNSKSYIDDDTDDQIEDEIPVDISLVKQDEDYKEAEEEEQQEILENDGQTNTNNMTFSTDNNEEISTLSIVSLNVPVTKEDDSCRKLPIRIQSTTTNKKILSQMNRTSTSVDFYVKRKLENNHSNERKLRTRENGSNRSIRTELKTANSGVHHSSIRSSVSLTNSQLFDSSDHHYKTMLNNRLQNRLLNEKLNNNSSRLLKRDMKFQRTKETSTMSPNSSFQSQEKLVDDVRQGRASPNYSLNSTVIDYSRVPRAYELKKLFPDTYDWGRVTNPTKRERISCNRQKWGTIVHPPFPLGYQRATHEQVVDVVGRLNSPTRCKHPHRPSQSLSKKYLSVEETDALIDRLTKVKSIRTDQYYSKGNNVGNVKKIGVLNSYAWKSYGIPT